MKDKNNLEESLLNSAAYWMDNCCNYTLNESEDEETEEDEELLANEESDEKLMDAARKIAKKAFGDDVDEEKLKGMVDKAKKIAKDESDIIGIIQSFFKSK